MTANYSFRKALNGFHREDVVRHLEYINTRHNNQLNQLQAELEAKEKELNRLRALEALPEQLAQLQLVTQVLQQEKQAADEHIAVLEAQLEEERSRQLAIVSRTEEELEAYRRAERLERQAQQRAEQLCDKANTIVSDAGARADAAARQIDLLSRQVADQLQQLRQEVLSSKDVLTDAAQALAALRPEEVEV